MKKSSIIGIVAFVLMVLFSISLTATFAQYDNQQTSDVTIPPGGVAHVDQSSSAGGLSIDIAGTPGAAGSVSTATYTGNPQPTADVPEGITLTRFVVVTFNFAASDFQGASITISYSDADVAGISMPYALYKYLPASNSFVQLNSVVDSNAKTITTSVSSPTDPLFAIGGATKSGEEAAFPYWIFILIAATAIIVVVAVVLILRRREPTFHIIEQ